MNNSMIVAVRLILGGGGRELPNDFPNHLQSFYSFTSSMRIPVSPHPQQHSFLSFFTLVIFVAVKSCLMVLVGIS